MIEALPALWIVVLTFLAAGTVKGIAGVGLPMTALGILTFFTDPRTAFATGLIPMILANAFQFWRAGDMAGAIRRYAPYLVCMVIGIPLVLTLTAGASEAFLLGVLGAVVVIFVILSFAERVPRIPDRLDTPAQLAAGSAAGILGGLVSVWTPAMFVYFTGRRVAKDEFIRASGLLLFAGVVPLTLGYAREGFLSGPLALLSVALVIPAGLGMLLGESLRNRLSETAFRNALLFMFLLIGLNLIRRSLFT